jgi:hypothetical protein
MAVMAICIHDDLVTEYAGELSAGEGENVSGIKTFGMRTALSASEALIKGGVKVYDYAEVRPGTDRILHRL